MRSSTTSNSDPDLSRLFLPQSRKRRWAQHGCLPARDDFSGEICGDVELVGRVRMTEDVVEEGLEVVALREPSLQPLPVGKLDENSKSFRTAGI